MAALALHDLFSGSTGDAAEEAVSSSSTDRTTNTATASADDRSRHDGHHPMDLFKTNAVHGGVWRCAFKTNRCVQD